MFGLMTKKEHNKRMNAMHNLLMAFAEEMGKWEEHLPEEMVMASMERVDRKAELEAAKLGLEWESPLKGR